MKEKFTLLFNDSKESKRTYKLVMKSGIPCEFLATSDEKDVPCLLGPNLREFVGFQEIKEYLRIFRKKIN